MPDVRFYHFSRPAGQSLAGEAAPTGLRDTVVTVGNFDGVHLGHQALIRRVVEDARLMNAQSVLITFQPHPQSVLRAHQVPILSSLPLRLRLFEQLGLDLACVIPFTPQFAQTSAEQFVREVLVAQFHVKKLVVGYDFAFGHHREGTAELLMQAGHTHGFGFEVFPAVTLGEEMVSSTRIRGLLQAGEFAQAQRLLGRPFSVLEPVMQGQRRGRELGFPTLNQVPEEPLPIPFGVYVVRARAAEQTLGGVANYGIRPTVEGHTPLLETHLFDWSGDLYGQLVEIIPLKRLREERKFASLEALKAQIARDSQTARQYLESHPQE